MSLAINVLYLVWFSSHSLFSALRRTFNIGKKNETGKRINKLQSLNICFHIKKLSQNKSNNSFRDKEANLY